LLPANIPHLMRKWKEKDDMIDVANTGPAGDPLQLDEQHALGQV
jgi:hypothetical protein